MSRTLSRLIRGLNPLEPKKEDLHFIFLQAIHFLNLEGKEKQLLENAFEISFDGHHFAPRRASGEIYFMHVFRQFLYATHLMCEHGVVSVKILVAILLHDTIEDAEKGKSTRFLAKSTIHLRIKDPAIDYFLMCMTKKIHPEKEKRDVFLKRIIACDAWEVLVAKPFDCNDNITTLAAVAVEKQPEKILEVYTHYPIMKERAEHFIRIAGEKGTLHHHERWLHLVSVLHRTLHSNAKKEEERLRELGVAIV